MSRIEFGPNGCKFKVGGGPCREKETLQIIQQFKQLYEAKLREIEREDGGGDNLEAKISLQRDWIRDLTEQNEMLVRAVEELEREATNRVTMLEEKLKNTARSGSEVMQKYQDFNFSINLDETSQKWVYLQNDVRNLLEFIRRVRDEDSWSIDGLQFYNVSCKDLYGNPVPCKCGGDNYEEENCEEQAAIEMKEKNGKLKELEDQLKQMTSQMQAKEKELAKVTQSMMDMRNALTIEVADKHDIILSLRRDVQQLEEQCRQSNKQTQFKDDIIKELRKEIKQLKAERGSTADEENANLLARLRKSDEENKALKDSTLGAKQELDKLYKQANGYVAERDDFKKKYNDSVAAIATLSKDADAAKDAFAKANNQNAEALKNMKESNQQTLAELERVRRDSEAMSQAQNGTIEALQQALTEKAQRRGVDESASAASWETATTTKGDASVQGLSGTGLGASAAGGTVSRGAGRSRGVDSGTSALADSESTAAGMLSQTEGGTGGVDPSEILQALRRGSVGELSRMLQKLAEERDIERAKHNQEVANLKATIDEVEKSLGGGQLEISGLQTQVDLFKNSINVLEAGQEKARIEISQQRLTISNLQEALITSKHQLEELQQKASSEIRRCTQCIHDLKNIFSLMENECFVYHKETENLSKLIEHLRDSNLDLEVENFGYVQDVAMMETRLLKYQNTSRHNEECICELENELIQLRVENSHLKQHLCALNCEVTAMQRVIDEAKQLHNSFVELEQAHADQLQQNDQIRQELIRQTKIKEIDTVRIRELQEMVVGKSEESDAYEQELCCCKKKLDMALSHNDELKSEISELLGNIQSYEQNCVINEERTDYCQQEIETCKGNLTELKDKLLLMNDLLHKKVEQYNELETNYFVQGNSLACLQKEIAENQLHHEEDQHDLKVAINDLNEKLIEADNNYRILHEDFKRSQAQVIDLTRKEAQLQQECARCKQECTLKLKQAENDALCMTECINKLKMDKSSDSLQKKVAEDELESLKNDFIKIEEEFNQIKETNEDLKDQLFAMQTSMQTCKDRNKATNDQYNKCVAELKIQQCAKQCLESENKQYKKQLAMLQRAHAELNRSYDQLLKSVIALETELDDSKLNRDKICVESRNVINNVQAWLQEQAFINKQLTQKFTDNAIIIYKLNQKIATMHALKCKCAGQEAVNSKSQKTMKRNPRTCDSGCLSAKDCSNADDYYQYTSENDEFMDEEERCYCVQRVETLSQLLQQSDKYWKSKMDDNDYVVSKDQ